MQPSGSNEDTQPGDEAYHRAREALRKSFKFVRPDVLPNEKKSNFRLASAEHEKVVVLIVNEGGDNNLHYHLGMDSVYFVMKGRVRFYSADGSVFGEYGPDEGIIMPAGARYRFEKIGTEEVQIFSVAVYPQGSAGSDRVNVTPPKPEGSVTIIEAPQAT
jgi:mannose-6-phosphate isomerase-like protein (cupin superfamily)